jgi:hypothetical protein
MTRRLISVGCKSPQLPTLPVWSALEELASVQFCFDRNAAEYRSCPLILIEPDEVMLSQAVAAGQPAFVFGSPSAASEHLSGSVVFSQEPVLDVRIRGRTVRHEPICDFRSLTPGAAEVVLAAHAGKPIWLARKEKTVQFLGVPFPAFPAGEGPFDFLNGNRFIYLLPLLHFLRQVTGDDAWQPPALRACMMFDDPNLHWSSYGFLPFRETTALAKQHNFHVACATVPLDSWYVHEPTAALFRQNSEWISLLIHGNDHLLQELGRAYEDEGEVRLLAQALRRIERLEQRAGFRVCRVMAPPHGACHPRMASAMSRLGFDGACISPWSLRDWGGQRQWPSAFGLKIAEMIGNFPVVPRFRMHSECDGWIIVNAFLNRPIIPVGHHDTVSDGLELLTKIAEIVNSLPNVQWCNMEQILLSNYLVRREGSILHIRPFTARTRITVPEGVTTLRFESGLLNEAPVVWRLNSRNIRVTQSEFSVEGETEVELQVEDWGNMDYRGIRPIRASVWAPARRVLCEIRDRVRPMLYRRRNVNASV